MFARVLSAMAETSAFKSPEVDSFFQGLGGASLWRDRWLGQSGPYREVLTSTRIMDCITCFSGNLSIRIHQSVKRYITLNDVRRAITVCYFYPDSSGQGGKVQIYLAAEKWMVML